MSNLLNAIGVLLTLGGFASFMIGLLRLFLPRFEALIPEEFKKAFSVQYGGLIMLVGLIFLYF